MFIKSKFKDERKKPIYTVITSLCLKKIEKENGTSTTIIEGFLQRSEVTEFYLYCMALKLSAFQNLNTKFFYKNAISSFFVIFFFCKACKCMLRNTARCNDTI